jgi:Pyruvate/2-oxoacid:ferredoxin oxidoreductase delta subunit
MDDPYYAGDGTHQVVIVDWDVCTGCTICAKECPWDTIVMIKGTDVEAMLTEDV